MKSDRFVIDGVEVNLKDKMRFVRISDRCFVVGEGLIIRVDDEHDGQQVINDLSTNIYNSSFSK